MQQRRQSSDGQRSMVSAHVNSFTMLIISFSASNNMLLSATGITQVRLNLPQVLLAVQHVTPVSWYARLRQWACLGEIDTIESAVRTIPLPVYPAQKNKLPGIQFCNKKDRQVSATAIQRILKLPRALPHPISHAESSSTTYPSFDHRIESMNLSHVS